MSLFYLTNYVGILIWTDGNKYEGDYKDGKRTGKGNLISMFDMN
jgi:hypothetical protein